MSPARAGLGRKSEQLCALSADLVCEIWVKGSVTREGWPQAKIEQLCAQSADFVCEYWVKRSVTSQGWHQPKIELLCAQSADLFVNSSKR